VDSHPTPQCVRGVLAGGTTHETSLLASRWPASGTALGQSITTSACAGSRAGTRTGIIFIHGIHGHASLPGFDDQWSDSGGAVSIPLSAFIYSLRAPRVRPRTGSGGRTPRTAPPAVDERREQHHRQSFGLEGRQHGRVQGFIPDQDECKDGRHGQARQGYWQRDQTKPLPQRASIDDGCLFDPPRV
jgi:hypothetical protein